MNSFCQSLLHPDASQINVCDSGLHAIDHANTRGGSAYAASGIGACQCRHMLVKRLGVGDLQKGEKYVIYSTYLHLSDDPAFR